jgi:outer membrane protein W
MPKMQAGLLLLLAALLLAGPAVAQDQRFAVRFGFILVEPTGDTTDNGVTRELNTKGGVEADFEWYFHPRVGLEVASLGSANVDVRDDGDTVAGITFSSITLGINGHAVRSEKVDFALGILAGGATYGDFEVEGSTATFDTKSDTAWGAQAFVDMSVSRKWAVNVGLKYLATQLELKDGSKFDYDPVVLRVMGVYRWGVHQ